PMYSDQSHIDGAYIAHDDGRKSRCRLVTMMTNRSSHMPILTMIEITNSQNGLSLNRLNHKLWIAITLQKIRNQYMNQYGPFQIRLVIMKYSYLLALSQPKYASIT